MIDPVKRASGGRGALTTLLHGLDAVAALNRHPVLTAQELADMLGLSRTAARRILDTLVGAGMAGKAPGDSHYRLAPGASSLSSGLSEEMILSHVATPLLHAATQDVGWTISLVTRAQASIVLQVTTARAAPYAIKHYAIGNTIPIAASQAGRVILAYLSDAARLALPGGADAFEPALAEQIRAQGYYAPMVSGEREWHLYTPVFVGARVPGCLIMRYMVSAVPRDKLVGLYVPRLHAIAKQISDQARQTMAGRAPPWVAQFARAR